MSPAASTPPDPSAPAATPEDHALAVALAAEAGELLLAMRTEAAGHGEAFDAEVLKDEADRHSHELLMKRLTPRIAAGDAVLSEEGRDDPVRLDRSRVWIVDPLDGTREFGEPPRSDWAVHVGLAIDGVPAAGAVALPALGLTLGTGTPPDAPGPMPVRPRVVVSRTRPPAVATAVAERLDGDLVALGSAGAKAMAIVRNEADVYVHAGGQYEWDSCAPVAVALAAGMHCSRIDGSPLRYNRRDAYLPDLLICRPELAEQALTAVAGFAEAGGSGG